MTKLTTRLIIATFATAAIYFSMVAATNAQNQVDAATASGAPVAAEVVTTPGNE